MYPASDPARPAERTYIMTLTDARIRALKPGPKDRWVGDGRGLYLRLRSTGAKTLVVRSKRGGRTRVITLGEWPHYGLAKARAEAARISADRSGAALPASSPTVKAVADEYFEARIAARYKRQKNARTYRDRLVREAGWRKVRDLAPVHLSAMVKAYAKTAPVGANRFLAFVKQVLSFAVESGYLLHSPAAALTRRIAGGEEAPRTRVLSDDELRKLWAAPGDHARLLRFLLLTGARIGEAQRATWAELDLAARRWRVPAAHTKSARAHWVALAPLTVEVLGPRGAAAALALRTASETSVQAWLARWCEREGIAPRFTPHDLRRTFATRLGSLGVAPHVIAKCLNHLLEASESINVYLHAEYEAERVAATEAWAAELARIVGATP